jgi:hypothetical protein
MHHAAAEHPLAVPNAAAVGPAARDPITAIRGNGLTGRVDRAHDDRPIGEDLARGGFVQAASEQADG